MWRAAVRLPNPYGQLEIQIEVPSDSNTQSALDRVGNLVTRFPELQAQFANQLFDDYNFFKQLDLEEGGLTEQDFERFPQVGSSADIWEALRPYRLWHGGVIDRYHGNSYLLMDVLWPNPHFFQVFFSLNDHAWQHEHTEFVG